MLIVGVCGGSGSGKTTLVEALLRRLAPSAKSAVIPLDAYYRSLSAGRDPNTFNFDHPRSLDLSLLRRHLSQARASPDRPLPVPRYDFASHQRLPVASPLALSDVRILFIEGVLLFADPALRRTLDVRVFVDCPADLRFLRRLQRDVRERGRTLESVIAQYQATVRPMHQRFVEPFKASAHQVVSTDCSLQTLQRRAAKLARQILQSAQQ
ncbi:MAG: uridine kinase [Verrucomicrobiales bacterium]|nr:uridine kinase [Verrucomicrobiales bacterium]